MKDGDPITHCWQCKQPLAEPGEYLGGIPVGCICDDCLELRAAEYKAKHPREGETTADRVRNWWEGFCPAEFKATDFPWLEKYIPNQLDAARKWNPKNADGKGLVLCGPTGAGKTRTLFDVMGRLAQRGLRTEYMAAETLARSIMDSFDRSGQLDKLVQRLTRAPLLAIDDFGQEKRTSRVSETLHAIIKGRCENRRPLIISTMLDRKSQLARFAPADRKQGESILARIRSYTVPPVVYPDTLPEYHNQKELQLAGT